MQDNKKPRNKKGQPHGNWEVYHDNGNLHFISNIINGTFSLGFEEIHNMDGKLISKIYYAR